MFTSSAVIHHPGSAQRVMQPRLKGKTPQIALIMTSCIMVCVLMCVLMCVFVCFCMPLQLITILIWSMWKFVVLDYKIYVSIVICIQLFSKKKLVLYYPSVPQVALFIIHSNIHTYTYTHTPSRTRICTHLYVLTHTYIYYLGTIIMYIW